jgi:hypothetical protein
VDEERAGNSFKGYQRRFIKISEDAYKENQWYSRYQYTDHTTRIASMMAMRWESFCCEKPLTHTVFENGTVGAKEAKVATDG